MFSIIGPHRNANQKYAEVPPRTTGTATTKTIRAQVPAGLWGSWNPLTVRVEVWGGATVSKQCASSPKG